MLAIKAAGPGAVESTLSIPRGIRKTPFVHLLEFTTVKGYPWHDGTGQEQLLLQCIPVEPGTRGPVEDPSHLCLALQKSCRVILHER